MNDDSIREIHGCKCLSVSRPTGRCLITAREDHGNVVLEMCDYEARLTSWQARYIASKLYRLARRIRDREEETS